MARNPTLVLAALALLLAMPLMLGARSDFAVLVGVHEIRMAAKPQPTTANCENDASNPGNGGFESLDWQVQGDTLARLNTATIPGGLGTTGAVLNELNASFDAWEQADAAVPDIDVTTGSSVRKQTANRTYDLLFARVGGNSIAVTYTWLWSDGAVESDTVFNSRLPWFIAPSEGDGCLENQPRYDLANIATHEFGHTYGLGHAQNGRWETMYPFGFTGETLKRTLGPGDIEGIRAHY
ncbi:MAG TPA: matrixin family metalloprotease [candidate division Zixibacteria bacterium]|nr:matrixin family metalloprotease [candidate division Zixibacteria bacterium]